MIALVTRPPRQIRQADLHSSKDVEFVHRKREGLRPCRASISWNTRGLHAVVVDGRKQGVIKKHFGTEKACVAICRKNMARKFVKILLAKHNPNILPRSEGPVSYAALKEKCRSICTWDYFSRNEPYAKILPTELKKSRAERRLKLDGFQVP